MKLEFDSPLDYTDGTVIDPTVAATMAYTVFADTVNPPVKTFPVPAAIVAAGTKNANGTVHVTIDLLKGDLPGFTPAPGVLYYFSIKDTVQENGAAVSSADAPVVSSTYQPTPQVPANFTLA